MLTDETIKDLLKTYFKVVSEIYSLKIVRESYREFMADLRKEKKNVGH